VVASATAQFQKDHPGWTVDVQYQNWGDHLQKFDATLAGGNTADAIEMGNTEMTKYMAARAVADITSLKSSFANPSAWLKDLGEVDRRTHRLQELLPGDVEGEQDRRREPPRPL